MANMDEWLRDLLPRIVAVIAADMNGLMSRSQAGEIHSFAEDAVVDYMLDDENFHRLLEMHRSKSKAATKRTVKPSQETA